MNQAFANLYASKDAVYSDVNSSVISKVTDEFKRQSLRVDFDEAVAAFGDKYTLDFPEYKAYLNTDRFEKIDVADPNSGEISEKTRLVKTREYLDMMNEAKKLQAAVAKLKSIGISTVTTEQRLADLVVRITGLDERQSIRFVEIQPTAEPVAVAA